MNEAAIAKILECALGYVELGMASEASEELGRLPAEARELPAAMRVRLVLAVKARDWPLGAQIGMRLVEAGSAMVSDYLQTAYCLHEMQRTGEAREVLLKAPAQAHGDSVYLYNLACYEAVLGRAQVALDYLDRAAAIDGSIRSMALKDPDLLSIRKFLDQEA